MNDKIILLDEMGNEKEFQILATFGLDEMDYAVLLPLNEISELTYILRIEYDDKNEPILVGIDDEEELEDVIEVYEEIRKERLQ